MEIKDYELQNLENETKNLISFVADKFKKEYGKFLSEDKMKIINDFINKKNVIVMRESSIRKDSPNVNPGPGRYGSGKIILTPIDYAYSYEKLIENLTSEEGKKLIKSQNIDEINYRIRHSDIIDIKDYDTYIYQLYNYNIFESVMAIAVHEMMHSQIELRDFSTKMPIDDKNTSFFGAGINESMVEYFARKLCLKYSDEYEEKYGYKIPLLPSIFYQPGINVARIYDNQLIDKTLIFNGNINDLLKSSFLNPELTNATIDWEKLYYQRLISNYKKKEEKEIDKDTKRM